MNLQYYCYHSRITIQLYSYSTARTMAMYGLLDTKSYHHTAPVAVPLAPSVLDLVPNQVQDRLSAVLFIVGLVMQTKTLALKTD